MISIRWVCKYCGKENEETQIQCDECLKYNESTSDLRQEQKDILVKNEPIFENEVIEKKSIFIASFGTSIILLILLFFLIGINNAFISSFSLGENNWLWGILLLLIIPLILVIIYYLINREFVKCVPIGYFLASFYLAVFAGFSYLTDHSTGFFGKGFAAALILMGSGILAVEGIISLFYFIIAKYSVKSFKIIGISLFLVIVLGTTLTIVRQNHNIDSYFAFLRYQSREDKGILYFINSEYMDRIFKITLGAKNAVRLSSGQATSIVAIKENFVYYTTRDGLRRVTLDGKNDTQIYSSNQYKSYIINEDWIYYCDNHNNIGKFKLDGSQRTNIFSSEDDLIVFGIKNEKLYFSERISGGPDAKFNISSIYLNGGNRRVLFEVDSEEFGPLNWDYPNFTMDDSNGYFAARHELFKSNLNEGGKQSIAKINGDIIRYRLIGDLIYISVDEGYSDSVYSVNRNGNGFNKAFTADGDIKEYWVQGNNIYYLNSTEMTRNNGYYDNNYILYLKDENNTSIIADKMFIQKIDGDYIYYSVNVNGPNQVNDKQLHRMKYDGSDKRILGEL